MSETITLRPGDNGYQAYWANGKNEDRQIDLFCNHGTDYWLAYIDGQIVNDEPATRRRNKRGQSTVTVVLAAPSAEKLAAKLKKALGLSLVLEDSSK